ncbi:MAG: nucleotide exchange factor GrpE [Micrococcales bacterium]|nr:nucleotide exchange factor GrpE [Micrococcales bacterium]
MVDPTDPPSELKTDRTAPDTVGGLLPGDPSSDEEQKEPTQTDKPGQFDNDDAVDDPPPTQEPITTTTVSPEPTTGDDDGSDVLATAIPWVLVVVLLAAVVALAVKAFGRRSSPTPVLAPVMAPVTASVPVVAPDPAASPVVPELITLADLITTPAAQTQAVRALRTVGVEPVEAVVGTTFNPDVHEAVATRPAETPDQAGTIAVVHRAGWRSARGVVRPAGVEVWTADTNEGA